MNQNIIRSCFFYLLLYIFSPPQISLGQTNYNIYSEGKKTGLKDNKGTILIKPIYNKLGWSSGLNIPVDNTIGYHSGSGWGVISLKGQLITDDKYYTLTAYHRDLLIASVKDRFSNRLFYGTINSKGETIIPFKYDEIETIIGLLVVSEQRDNQHYYGLFTQDHDQISPISAYQIDYFTGKLLLYTDSLGKQGLMTKSGAMKIAPSMDSISACHHGYAKTFNTGKIGLIDSLGNIIHSAELKSIENQTLTHFDVFEIRDQHNQIVYKTNGDSISVLDHGYITVHRNGFTEILDDTYKVKYSGYGISQVQASKWHLTIQKNNKYLILKKNDSLLEKHSFDSLLTDKNHLYGQWKNKWYIYDIHGNLISKRTYEQIIPHSNGLIPVKSNGYWGYIDPSHGEIAITLKYDSVSVFKGPLAQVNHIGFKNIINQSGEIIGSTSYDSIFIDNNQTAVVKSGSRTDIINNRGQIVFQTYNSLLKHDSEHYIEETETGAKGLITKDGRIVFYPEMDSVSQLHDGRFFILQKNGQYAVSHLGNNYIIPFDSMYNKILHISDGYIGIILNQKYGFINSHNQLIIANRYDSIETFTNGLCPVQVNGHWGYINQKEILVIQPNLDQVSAFKNGLAVVQRDGFFGILNSYGKVSAKITYDSIIRTHGGNFIVKKHDKYGLLNTEGNKTLGLSYDSIQETKQGTLIVKRREKHGVINTKGVYEIPLKYDEISEKTTGLYICRTQIKE